MKRKKEIKYKHGGYYKEEEIEPGITVMEMDGKGFYNRFKNKERRIV